MRDFTLQNLEDVEDSAPRYGHGERQEVRFAQAALDAESTGLALHRIRPGRRQPFGHRHTAAEEVYVVLGGTGRVRLDEEERELRPYDAVRVAPHVARRFEAGPEGMELLVFGPRHEGDGELLPDFWAD